MRHALATVLIALTGLLAWAGPAGAAKEVRIALVIGNGAYQTAPLANPVNDARLIAATLQALGFEVAELVDADQKTLKRAVKDFGERLDGAGEDAVGLFYYAGHGVQVAGVNYMIPVDAEIRTEADVDIESVSANSVLGTMEFARNRLNFMILDACRNNPYARGFRSSVRGLARMDAPAGTLIAYATSPGDVAADGTGLNSPFSAALAEAMVIPGVPAEQMFKRVRIAVRGQTDEQQTPWESSSLTGDFYFKPGPISGPGSDAGAVLPEIEFWASIRDSTNTSDFRAYLRQYPKGTFAPLARNRLAALAPTRPPSDWYRNVVAVYEGELTNPVRPKPDKVITRFEWKNDALSGTYKIIEPNGTTQGRLTAFEDTGGGKGRFRWADPHGTGTLILTFSADLASFTGSWQPEGLPDLGGTWSGKR